MLGLWSAHAQTFLLVLVVLTSLVFALPIFFVPLVWARVFQWHLPEHTHLAVYFGRCLGAFVLIAEALLLRASLTGDGLVYSFQMLLMIALSMVLVHVWGAVARIQPWTENLEIGGYSALALLAVLFYPAA